VWPDHRRSYWKYRDWNQMQSFKSNATKCKNEVLPYTFGHERYRAYLVLRCNIKVIYGCQQLPVFILEMFNVLNMNIFCSVLLDRSLTFFKGCENFSDRVVQWCRHCNSPIFSFAHVLNKLLKFLFWHKRVLLVIWLKLLCDSFNPKTISCLAFIRANIKCVP